MRELLSQDMPMYYLEILNLTGLYLQQIPSSQKLCVIVNRFKGSLPSLVETDRSCKKCLHCYWQSSTSWVQQLYLK
ncbi:uncharacterized protein [Arachis hypogaea]|uniref:uncharacterized protein isoform X5 n=1 Tax=Arachis hypogaea TaxID=3818 RepID=UPI003B21C1E0